ncbi:integrase catalytic domain-containing protein [Trichonephila clavipes]|nr:integrase catalytic domain-containing protein [Trichonephila clavipes]
MNELNDVFMADKGFLIEEELDKIGLSPHCGGLWEAGVKSIKYQLKRVIGNTNLTFEEFSTLLTQVEAILNSRPLVSLDCDNDPDSLNILTPSHFLIGEVITSSPEHTNDDKLSLRSRWDIVQKMNDEAHFWLNGYVNKQNCHIWSEANPQVSCDLTPLDYFLWGYVNSLVYADKPQTPDQLEDNIRLVIADIRPQMSEKVIENWTSRLDYIRASRGSPMPEIIFKM